MGWRARRFANLALRLAGLALSGIAASIDCRMFAAPDPQARMQVLSYLLALIDVVSTSAGAALLVLGLHLFDPVDLPSRWKIHRAPRRSD